MNEKDLKDMVGKLTAEDESLVATIRKAMHRREKIQSILLLLATLDGDPPPKKFDGKLADAIRAVLKQNADRTMSPTEVRDAVKVLGYEHPDEGNLMPAIHGVLKRLHESGDARTKTGKDGGTRYQWRGDRESVRGTGTLVGPILSAAQITQLTNVANITDSVRDQLNQLTESSRQVAKLMENSGLSDAVNTAMKSAAIYTDPLGKKK